MWFKNILLFELNKPVAYSPSDLEERLNRLIFSPCLPSLPLSVGWVSPVELEYAPLVHATNGYMMICLQVEEKILPPIVIRQELKDRINEIETARQIKISTKQKYAIKDEIYSTLLPRAFTKKTRIYAYFDIKNNWLILDCTSEFKIKLFLDTLKKVLPDLAPSVPKLKKLAAIMTQWLKNNNEPNSLEIKQACVLQDRERFVSSIRCQGQDLSASGIQSLLQDGYEASQLALTWNDQLTFNLKDDFSLHSLRFSDTLLEQASYDSEDDSFDVDFVIMTGVLAKLLKDLTRIFATGDDSDV